MSKSCRTCLYNDGTGHFHTQTFEKDGYAVCSKIAFNSAPFWDGDDAHWDQKTDKPVAAAWVVDASDYWAALHITPDFWCCLWTEKGAK